MKIVLPPPLTNAPAARSPGQDFLLLLKNQLRLTYKKIRYLPIGAWIGISIAVLGILSFLGFSGYMIYTAASTLPELGSQYARGFLSVIFMMGLAMQVFFGVTTAFVTLYMSDDLELLFVAPVSVRAVFAVKSLVIASSNLLVVLIFIFLPGIFYGVLFDANAAFYILVVIVGLGIWTLGTALAELLNLFIMRIVPPHRVREAVGFIGALAAIVFVLIFQLPNILTAKSGNIDIASWLVTQTQPLTAMDFLPWGWGSFALATGISGNFLGGLFWALFLLIISATFFGLTFLLVERGFRRGWISFTQAAVKKRKKGPRGMKSSPGVGSVPGVKSAPEVGSVPGIGSIPGVESALEAGSVPGLETALGLNRVSETEFAPGVGFLPGVKSASEVGSSVGNKRDVAAFLMPQGEKVSKGSVGSGILAIAFKDLLYLKRDTREWFGYLLPLIIMVFFAGQFLFLPTDSTRGSTITVLILYSVMFSGNLALQSFGREGEADWILNSVPLAGWPVVWGKLLAAVIPTLFLMEALLIGTALALGFSITITMALGVGAILLTLGASAIGLFYSINNCRFNPENPQQRISPSASMVMYLVNLFFMLFLALGLVYVFPPTELIAVVKVIPSISFKFALPELFIYLFYLLSRPFLWAPVFRILLGVSTALAVWAAVFFGFMSFTVRQSSKGLRVQIVTKAGKKPRAQRR